MREGYLTALMGCGNNLARSLHQSVFPSSQNLIQRHNRILASYKARNCAGCKKFIQALLYFLWTFQRKFC